MRGRNFEIPPIAPEFRAEPWSRALLDAHTSAHYLSFRHEMDAELFESFRSFKGVRGVVENISNRQGFLPEATWLIIFFPPGAVMPIYCASIQATIDHDGLGAIQNVGVIPAFRRRGLARHCLMRSLAAFKKACVPRVHLEVTAANESALELYRKVGFTATRVVYKTR